MPIAMPPMVEMLQWHRVHDYDPANQWFRRLLKAAVNDLPREPPGIPDGRHSRQSPPKSSAPRRGPRRTPRATSI
jgi:hypothetical protein